MTQITILLMEPPETHEHARGRRSVAAHRRRRRSSHRSRSARPISSDWPFWAHHCLAGCAHCRLVEVRWPIDDPQASMSILATGASALILQAILIETGHSTIAIMVIASWACSR